MLTELRVRNLALVESAEIRFGPGLNAVTGATGAGKSLLLQALTLLLGGRWSREMLRTGADRMRVQGMFEIADPDVAARLFELLGEDVPGTEATEHAAPEDGAPLEVLITRSIDASGRNRADIDGHLVPVATLREAGKLVAEIHGQSEHQALQDSAWQTSLLDRAAELAPQQREFAERLALWRTARQRLDSTQSDAEARRQRAEELEAVAADVAAVAPEVGEGDALRDERELLTAVAKHRESLSTAITLIGESAGAADESAVDRVGHAARSLEGTAALSADVRAAVEALDAASEQLQEAWRLIEAALDGLEADPERLDRVQERLEDLGVLLRRHGPTEEDALRTAADAREEAAKIRAEDADASELEAKVAELSEAALAAGLSLDDARRKGGLAFSERVRATLAELEMAGTRFEVDVPARSETALQGASPQGLGPVTFLVSPNVGEDLRPLARIASGGELARMALAIKGELAGTDGVPLLAFDEIDADVGPRLGPVIGRRLARLARDRQVFVITHLPQVAAHAAHHLRVAKSESDGRTTVHVDVLEGADREREIAEMIRGPGRADEALGQARAMLAEGAEE